MLEHIRVLAAHYLDIEVIIVAQSIHKVVSILLGARPMLVGYNMKNVNHRLMFLSRVDHEVKVHGTKIVFFLLLHKKKVNFPLPLPHPIRFKKTPKNTDEMGIF